MQILDVCRELEGNGQNGRSDSVLGWCGSDVARFWQSRRLFHIRPALEAGESLTKMAYFSHFRSNFVIVIATAMQLTSIRSNLGRTDSLCHLQIAGSTVEMTNRQQLSTTVGDCHLDCQQGICTGQIWPPTVVEMTVDASCTASRSCRLTTAMQIESTCQVTTQVVTIKSLRATFIVTTCVVT